MLSEPVCPFGRHGFVASCMVPFAHPHNVLWCGWDSADGAELWLAILSMVYAFWTHVLGRFRCSLGNLLICWRYTRQSEEVLVVLPLSQPGDPLAPGLKEQSFFDLPPRVLDADLILQHVVRGLSCPPVKTVGLPVPLCQIGNGCCERSFHSVPCVLLVNC